ncbi:glycine receptor subunit alpha-2-like isoform X2 [Uloborus diversus]|uniref:glycine receptor subunit alpha-2-like isoform X2 n=1 Tax=Uloborus diversus TaxID=327109 RepID=UPI00240A5143|nr:glycine receptor subunit alpha-2-like isoform X2 [Uloborus diversus]
MTHRMGCFGNGRFQTVYLFMIGCLFLSWKIVITDDLRESRSIHTFYNSRLAPFEEDENTTLSIHSTTESPEFIEEAPFDFLDQMLEKYDKRAWPTYGMGIPTVVTINMYINSFGSINAASMEFSMDIYLRQSWIDSRLRLSRFGINNTVTLNGQDIIDNIWKPDLFFRNLKAGNFHSVTVPNKLIKISPDGRILFSMRLTLRLSCHMTFRHYPLDKQQCWVVLGSYAQTMDQVVIQWQERNPLIIEQELELPEFDLIPQSPGSFQRDIDTGSFSFLNVSFILVRQNGYHLVQTYLPTFLIVTISWVSFWLHVDATPARVTLGVTTLLTLTTVASGIRTQLPPVSYVKAIDVWIGVCSIMKSRQVLEFYKGDLNYDEKIQDPKLDQTFSPEEDKKESLKRALTVDKICRILFPCIFLIFNLAYWTYYLNLA